MFRGLKIMAGTLAMGVFAWGAAPAANPGKDLPTFGVLKTPTGAETKAQAEAWLSSRGAISAEARKAFNAIWDSTDTLSGKLAQTFALGDTGAAKILQEARHANLEAPMEIPALFKDNSKSLFYRANLAVAYARVLGQNKVYDLGLETLKLFRPEQVADPATFLFQRAVAEYSLMLKKEADDSITRLLDDVSEAPERYRNVAALMSIDMMSWREKDLGWISRKMGTIHRRLDLAQGGKKTQKMQKEVVARLDEMIKELENQAKSGGT
ncbi:MAG: hypothetical protein EXR99_08745 [Gemmataceae bacterium]|nr:hypothetical protein [Gemmataceae bacterium]